MKEKETSDDTGLLKELISAFTRYPKDLIVELDRKGVIVVQANMADQPFIVGAQNRNFEALRTIMRFVAARRKEKVTVILDEPSKGRREVMQPYSENPDWRPEKALELIKKVLSRILNGAFEVEPISAKTTTILEVTVRKEDERVMEVLQPYLHTIFHAIGRFEGRSLYVEVNKNDVVEAFS